MKKTILSIFSILILSIGLVGCGNEEDSKNDDAVHKPDDAVETE